MRVFVSLLIFAACSFGSGSAASAASIAWSIRLPADEAPTSYASTGREIVLTTPFAVLAYDAKSAKRLWQRDALGTRVNAFADDVYVFVPGVVDQLSEYPKSGFVERVDPRSGRTLWSVPTENGVFAADRFGEVIATKNEVVALRRDGGVAWRENTRFAFRAIDFRGRFVAFDESLKGARMVESVVSMDRSSGTIVGSAGFLHLIDRGRSATVYAEGDEFGNQELCCSARLETIDLSPARAADGMLRTTTHVVDPQLAINLRKVDPCLRHFNDTGGSRLDRLNGGSVFWAAGSL